MKFIQVVERKWLVTVPEWHQDGEQGSYDTLAEAREAALRLERGSVQIWRVTYVYLPLGWHAERNRRVVDWQTGRAG